ncbi:hypothetical protein BS78_07G168800 [Paspalum vaginatum]|nr:hypothetical protein BS78_07G168800 [Paspalum vaginatum]
MSSRKTICGSTPDIGLVLYLFWETLWLTPDTKSDAASTAHTRPSDPNPIAERNPAILSERHPPHPTRPQAPSLCRAQTLSLVPFLPHRELVQHQCGRLSQRERRRRRGDTKPP